MRKNGQGYKKKPKALMNAMLELMNKVEQLKLEHGEKESKKQAFPHPTHHALELKKTTSEPKPEKVSSDVEYNPTLTSGSEAEDEMGDFVKRAKVMGKKSTAKSTAKSSSGSGFIKGQTLKPINEKIKKYVIGKSATLPFNDLENDSFLVKPRSYEPVI
jgi:hypothetical protein